MNIFSLFQILIFINTFESIISLRYPINKDLDNSTGQINLIEIETRKSYLNYTKEGKVISLFYANFCRYCGEKITKELQSKEKSLELKSKEYEYWHTALYVLGRIPHVAG